MDRLLLKIKQKTGLDFSQYRLNCLKRRIDSRLRVHHLTNYKSYLEILEKDPDELETLIKIITINFTSFFRDKQAWMVIEKQIIPEIILEKLNKNQKNINVWSAGTSSGEEAYTLASLFAKKLKNDLKHFSLTIYATDIDKDSLKKARQACYPPKAIELIPKDILNDYFNFNGETYEVSQQIRDLVHFKWQDLLSPNHLPTMDLIVCRNVLIYFTRELQSNIFRIFHQKLRKNGFLMLGKTESLITFSQPYFESINSREKIYKKLNG